MTSRHVERISGYEVRVLIQEPRRYCYALYDGDTQIAQATASTPKESLDLLVRINFDRIGQIICKEQGGRCLMCGKFSSVGLQRHHMTPRSRGRDDRRENLCGLCPDSHQLVTDGRELTIHPEMERRMLSCGLEFSPSGFRRVNGG